MFFSLIKKKFFLGIFYLFFSKFFKKKKKSFIYLKFYFIFFKQFSKITLHLSFVEIFFKNDSYFFNCLIFFFSRFYRFKCFKDLIGDFFLLGNNYFNVVKLFLQNNIENLFIELTRFSKLNVFFTVSNVFFGTQWCEREVRDLFGYFFLSNLDLRRLITDYGFRGYPLLKHFPLTGFYEIRRNEMTKSLCYRPVKFCNEFISLHILKNVF